LLVAFSEANDVLFVNRISVQHPYRLHQAPGKVQNADHGHKVFSPKRARLMTQYGVLDGNP